jgi:hypothetical protein
VADKSAIEVGQVWKRNAPYKERVRVKRIWNGQDLNEDTGEWIPVRLVRVHPVHGGRPMVASVEVLRAEFTLEASGEVAV